MKNEVANTDISSYKERNAKNSYIKNEFIKTRDNDDLKNSCFVNADNVDSAKYNLSKDDLKSSFIKKDKNSCFVNADNVDSAKYNLSKDDLQLDGLHIFQNMDGYKFASDAVFLANFVKAKKNDFVIDFCSGSGIVGILVQHKNCCENVVCVEMQASSAEISALSVNHNNKNQYIKILNEKIQNLSYYFENNSADVIVCNPPYKKTNACKPNNNEMVAVARHEITINIEEIIQMASKLLKSKGKFYVCNDAIRTAEIIAKLKKHKLEPKKIFFTYPAIDKNASLVFIEAIKDGKEDLLILPAIISNDQNGKFVQYIQKLFN